MADWAPVKREFSDSMVNSPAKSAKDKAASLHEPSPEDNGNCDIPPDKDFVARLAEYAKYLYEEENERRDVLNNTTKLYFFAFSFVVGVGLVKIVSIEQLPSMVKNLSSIAPGGNYVALLVALFFLASFGLFCASFLFAILVMKMWKRERLHDPRAFVFRAMTMPSEARLLSDIVADYAVAAEKNHRINELKARLLSKALRSFICALVVFVLTWTFVQTVDILWR